MECTMSIKKWFVLFLLTPQVNSHDMPMCEEMKKANYYPSSMFLYRNYLHILQGKRYLRVSTDSWKSPVESLDLEGKYAGMIESDYVVNIINFVRHYWDNAQPNNDITLHIDGHKEDLHMRSCQDGDIFEIGPTYPKWHHYLFERFFRDPKAKSNHKALPGSYVLNEDGTQGLWFYSCGFYSNNEVCVIDVSSFYDKALTKAYDLPGRLSFFKQLEYGIGKYGPDDYPYRYSDGTTDPYIYCMDLLDFGANKYFFGRPISRHKAVAGAFKKLPSGFVFQQQVYLIDFSKRRVFMFPLRAITPAMASGGDFTVLASVKNLESFICPESGGVSHPVIFKTYTWTMGNYSDHTVVKLESQATWIMLAFIAGIILFIVCMLWLGYKFCIDISKKDQPTSSAVSNVSKLSCVYPNGSGFRPRTRSPASSRSSPSRRGYSRPSFASPRDSNRGSSYLSGFSSFNPFSRR